jgi:beta-lactamase regulating signal transducer with metallopeptidase domain
MIDFLIKSTLSLLVLLAIYHLILEKEKMHQFNRFYLLFCLVFSFVIPFISIEIIDESVSAITHTNKGITANATMTIVPETLDYTPIIIWSLYCVVTSLLLFRFLRNILRITSRTHFNTVINYKNAKLVLLKEKTLPHTFWNTIFVNETEYRNRKIEEELYTHELIHVTQKHTLDVLLIEIVKTLFWFNPLFIFYKKAIQLNHEFLADEKVVNSFNNVPFYQSLLLSKANENQPFYLASNLNYLVTKKRFLMMTKNKSQTKEILKKILLLPILSGLVYFLCIKTVAQESNKAVKNQSEKKGKSTIDRRDEYYAGVHVVIKDCTKKTIIDKQYEQLTLEEKNNNFFYVPKPFIEKSPTENEYKEFKNAAKYAIWVDDEYKQNEYLNNFNPNDIVFFQGSTVLKNARSKKFPQPFQYHLYTKDYFDKNLKNSHLKFTNKELIITKNCLDKFDKTKNFEETIKTNKSETTDKSKLEEMTVKPEFPGGVLEFYKFIGANFKVPAELKSGGKVFLTFIVEKDGSLSEFEIVKDLGFGTADEVIRVLKLSPKWIPGKENNEIVRVKYSLPVQIEPENK